ncbi:MAG: hypothetical protein FJ088_08305, partial [Deltaproteobacteria bacterium]|nr:hypothetical protein [Deltaproteobacteria bacterium]
MLKKLALLLTALLLFLSCDSEKRPATEVSEEQEAEQDIQQSGEDAQAEPEENYGEAVDGGTEAP